MQVALVTTALDEPTRGNHTTVQRWLRNVRGIDVRAWDPTGDCPDFVPDLFHGYHALHGGEPARELAARHGRPLVISLGGTDAQHLAEGGPRGARVAAVLESAQCVTGAVPCFGPVLETALGRRVPYDAVRRGVELPDPPPPRAPNRPLRVLLPAGLRPVKDPLLALDLAERLNARGVALELRVLGPTLDDAYASHVRTRAAELPFVTLDRAPPERMPQEYERADVVWNTSLHEGGANALLEAAARGCAVFARDVVGNRGMLTEPGAIGTLWDGQDANAAERFHRAVACADASGHAERIARGRAWLSALHDPADEAAELVRCWERVLAAR